MTLPPAAVTHLLATSPVARLATMRPDGRPHQVPIVFAFLDDQLWSPIDGKLKPDRDPIRIENIRHNPQVSVLLDRYTDDWRQLWWIRIDGTAEILTTDVPDRDPAFIAAGTALRAKYPQYDTVPLFREPATLLRIPIATLRTWCATLEPAP